MIPRFLLGAQDVLDGSFGVFGRFLRGLGKRAKGNE